MCCIEFVENMRYIPRSEAERGLLQWPEGGMALKYLKMLCLQLSLSQIAELGPLTPGANSFRAKQYTNESTQYLSSRDFSGRRVD